MNDQKIKEEGIYIFGGLNKNDEIHKDLRILKLDNFPSLIIPQTTGKPPGERFGHSMALNYA